jgi:hypothetical protein
MDTMKSSDPLAVRSQSVHLKPRSARALRRRGLCLFAAGVGAVLAFAATPVAAVPLVVSSPDSRLVAQVDTDNNGHLTWSLRRDRNLVIEPSPLGLTVDGQDLGQEVTLGQAKSRILRERYPWRGGKRWATNY